MKGISPLNRLRIIVKDFIFLFKKEWKTMLVILASLSVSIGISIVLLSFMFNQFEEIYNIQKDKRTYDINLFFGDSEQIDIRNFDKIFLKNSMEPVDVFLQFPALREYTIVTDENFSPPTHKQIGNVDWNAVFTKEQLAQLSINDYIPKITKGRWFEKEEIDNGGFLAVVDASSFPEVNIDDMIKIAGGDFRVIGITEPYEISGGQSHSGNYICYNTMLSLSDNKNGFTFSGNFTCVFDTPLSQEQLDMITTISTDVRCLFDIHQGNLITGLILAFSLTALVLFLVIANVYNLYRHLIRKSIYRFMVYKLCGGTRGFLFKCIYLNSFILTAISCGLGICIYHFFLKTVFEQYARLKVLDLGFIFAIFLVVIIYNFIVLLKYARSIVKMSPVDRTGWQD